MVDRRPRLRTLGLGVLLLMAGCTPPAPDAAGRGSAVLLFAGDAMLGRGVAEVATADPDGLFAEVRRVIRGADIAAVNLESPLTHRLHALSNPYALEADPATAGLLAAAGFDVAGMANNHAGDAGRESVLDTVEAITKAGMSPVGGGDDAEAAWTPVVIEASGVRIAFLAFDGSGQGLIASARSPGVASWDPDRARVAVSAARNVADIVTVALHGGLENWAGPDPLLGPVAMELAEWGVDVVWGHGPHVVQPVALVDPDGDGRPTVVATSLGNFLFDQRTSETSRGLLLEVLVDQEGVVATRLGVKQHDDLRVHFAGWEAPHSDAALIDGEWWALHRPVELADTTVPLDEFAFGDVIAAAAGDLTGSGDHHLLVSYRHPVRGKDGEPLPPPPAAEQGRSAHLGVLDAEGAPIWMARRPPHPIEYLAVCDGAAGFAYSTLDDPAVVATGAGVWSGFGFVLDVELPGPGSVGCADVDGDGLLDPVVVRS